jgi:hypothetical protein
MYAIRAASRPLRRVMATASPIARALATTASNSTPAAAAQNGSTDGAATPRATARKQLLTLSEIDRLLTHVSSEYSKVRGRPVHAFGGQSASRQLSAGPSTVCAECD